MGLLRAIERAAPLIVAGVAAGWYLRRQGLLGGPKPTALPRPPQPTAVAEPASSPVAEPASSPVAEPAPAEPAQEVDSESPEPEVLEDESAPEPPSASAPREQGIDAHLEAVEAVSDAADVTAVVEDLLAAAPSERPREEEEERIADAEVVEEPDERHIAEAVRVALAEQPGLLGGSVEVDVKDGTVWLRGRLEDAQAIAAAERRAAAVEGVREVRNLLQLTEKPSA